MPARAAAAAIAIAIVIVIVVFGLWMVGTPRDARERRFDEQRVNDLRGIASAVTAFRASRKALPVDLADISAWPDRPVVLRDPETNEMYEYRPLAADAYEVCAAFSHASEDEPATGNAFWKHPAGRHCYRVMVE